MKKIFLTLILSFAILSCETPTQAESDFPSVVDSTQYEEIANGFNDALNSQDVDLAMTYFSDDAVWSFPNGCLLYTSPSPRDATLSRMPSSA